MLPLGVLEGFWIVSKHRNKLLAASAYFINSQSITANVGGTHTHLLCLFHCWLDRHMPSPTVSIDFGQ